jgi:hypothetical protein
LCGKNDLTSRKCKQILNEFPSRLSAAPIFGVDWSKKLAKAASEKARFQSVNPDDRLSLPFNPADQPFTDLVL